MSDDILIWQFEDDSDDDWQQLPPRPRPSPAQVFFTLVGLVILMALAGVGGYVIGRQQRVMSLARADLQAVIDLETWAARAGNDRLFRSLLDPSIGPELRRALEDEFRQAEDRVRQATIERLSLDGDLARVEVRVEGTDGEHREVRFYRLVNGEWRRTAPRPESG